MAVKCLNEHQKKYICYFFNMKQQTQKELAENFKVSERTIYRVLEEAGLFAAKPQVQEQDTQCIRLLRRFNVTPTLLEKMLLNHVKDYR